MIELRKVIVFIGVLILLLHMTILLSFTKKKWRYKTYTFVILIGGIILVTVATFFDMLRDFLVYDYVHYIIKICFTVGGIIYIIGIIQWSVFTKSMMNKLEKIALTDFMTGVLNRNGIEQIYYSLSKEKDKFYVIVCDLDGTKRINDTYGHLEGDKYIKKTAQIITNVIRSNGYVSRIGGDEFVILIKSIEPEQIEKILLSIRTLVTEIFPHQNTSISLGYASYPNEGLTLKELIKAADEKMYKDKGSHTKTK